MNIVRVYFSYKYFLLFQSMVFANEAEILMNRKGTLFIRNIKTATFLFRFCYMGKNVDTTNFKAIHDVWVIWPFFHLTSVPPV